MNELTKTKTQTLGNTFYGSVTFNGPMFDIHDNAHVVIHRDRDDNYEASGTGVKRDSSDCTLSSERFARALKVCQPYFWAQSSWAVVYCVCRDHLEMGDNVSEFERGVEILTLAHRLDYSCPRGTVQKAIDNSPYMRYPIGSWGKHGAKERAVMLAERLVEELG